MAKWKAKFAAKVLNNKKEESHEQQKPNDYFHNIVPPITSSLDSKQNASDVQKIRTIKDVQVTSSFVIPLNERAKQSSYPPYPNNNDFFQQEQNLVSEPKMDTMALVSFKNNFKIPQAIGFEIRIEKLKQLLMSLFSLIVISICSTFIGFYFSDLNLSYIPHPVLTIPLLIFSLMILAVNLVDFFSLKKEVNLYIEKTLKGSLMPPNFIIRNYRKIHGRLIIFNWMFSFCYVLIGLITLIMYLISGQKLTFLIQSWTVTVPDLKTDAVTLSVVLAVMFFIHMMSIVFFKKRKGNIISYYGYEVVSPNDLEVYKKKINRICLIIAISFIAIIFFAIAIPILVVRRRKKKA
ncbi:MSC_0882 family membrane protein [Spiroplasma platyhelix]|uniref:Transmembrane protein n=1 Tax=Spiroplasma platyhelix PALS-1 TaxID=1276218 RepID=A0A846U2L0_9MOLU|nr:hypothetical protein [Spiroplasma platyhelix]MBE4704387.1 hypothetical protein [Spiroplasma platyhelix PALS-1]NKE38759.1 hypothetical protein [Spiroplasma platyhelix PALS-1]UJB28970.1 hypothetical protein SPLAT_v1c02050 [Spiroplasma platyhelix PALS-1]